MESRRRQIGLTRCAPLTLAVTGINSPPPRPAVPVLLRPRMTGWTIRSARTRELREPTARMTLNLSGGSIIDPATVGGTYGLRPTWNAISLKGALPLQASQDTAGFFARDAVQGAAFARGWYGDRFDNYTSFPKVSVIPCPELTFRP
jgi:hypothetical protein